MRHVKVTTTSFLMFVLFFVCCKKDPVIPNEQETITTLTYTLTPSEGGDNIVLSFRDLDGEGGKEPTISEGTLQANKTYTGNLTLLNEQASPTEDVTKEILKEDEDHQFFFKSTVPNLTVAYTDKDENNHPLGLATRITTQQGGNGTLTITLRHKPNKSAQGVSSGQIANAGGETDIEVVFTIRVQ